MPYYTGAANDWAALLSALQSACTSNGWTLSGDVLHKGNVYVRPLIMTWAEAKAELAQGGSVFTPETHSLYIRPGTGIDGGNELVDAPVCMPRIGRVWAGNSAGAEISIPFTFPIQYEVHVHTDPDEVFLIVKHDVDYFQQMSFGHSPLAEATGGTGCWIAASLPPQVAASNTGARFGFVSGPQYMGVSSGGNGQAASPAPAPPCFVGNHQGSFTVNQWSTTNMDQRGTQAARTLTHTINHGIDGQKWSGGQEFQANVSVTADPKLVRGINEIDGSAPLIRPIASLMRADSKVSTVAQFEHFRLLRIDHLLPGELYEIGPDVWKIYPFMRRSPDGSFPLGPGSGSSAPEINHSGYLGWAVRYDGA